MKSLSELREFAANKKSEGIYPKYVLRRISPFFTWILLRLGVSANAVTSTGLLIALAGSLMFTSASIYYWFLGYLMYQLYLVLDCCDGAIAVHCDQKSEFGAFLDRISHPITNSALVFFTAFGAYTVTDNLYLLIFSASGGIAFTLTSLLAWYKSQQGDKVDRSSHKSEVSGVLKYILKYVKSLAFAKGGLTHPLIALLLIDYFFIPDARVLFPVLMTVGGFAVFFKRFLDIRKALKG